MTPEIKRNLDVLLAAHGDGGPGIGENKKGTTVKAKRVDRSEKERRINHGNTTRVSRVSEAFQH